MTELRRPELLDSGRHERRGFDCGNPHLDEWLQRFAGQSRRRDTAATWVIADRAGTVVAYATLSVTSVDLGAAPPAMARQSPDPVPALLCGRFGVDRGVAGLGVGTALLAHILATAVEMNQKAAMKAVIVTAIDEPARRWWQRFGFGALTPTPGGLDLYLLTKDVEATLRRL